MQHAAPAGPMGVGVVGLGTAGIYHVERLSLRDDVRIIAAHDDCADAAERASGTGVAMASSWKGLLDDERIDLVVIATPPATHAALAIEALSAGRHVLVETPLGLNTVEVEAIVAASIRAGRSVIAAQTRRHDEAFCTALSCLRSGGLGRLVTLKHVAWRYSPHEPASRSGDAASRLAADMRPFHWRTRAATGGGLLWEAGIHLFDQLIQFAGLPEDVLAQRIPGASSPGIDDGFLAWVRFPAGVAAHVEVHRAAPVELQTGWIVVGDAGSCAGGTHYSVTLDGEIVDVPLTPVRASVDGFYAAVVAHLRHAGANPAGGDESRATVALIEAAHRSLRSGRRELVEL